MIQKKNNNNQGVFLELLVAFFFAAQIKTEEKICICPNPS